MTKGFIAGLLLGVLVMALFAHYNQHVKRKPPCLQRCGEGTVCKAEMCVAADDDKKGKKRRLRRKAPRARASGDSSLRKPTAAQLSRTSGGQALGKVDYINLAGELGGGKGELSQAQVTARVRRLDPEIVGCIQKASQGYDLGGRRVKVEVAFRIERSGRVKKVRVKAPRLLHQQGLLSCVRPLLRALIFPESGRALIMSYPYALD